VADPVRGLLLVDKPAGPSSFALVKRAREEHDTRAGHAGTLDPFATGLLLVLLGAATRLSRYLVGLDKRYVTEIRLGERTATGDLEGDTLEQTALPDLEQALAALRGEVALPIPAASAVKIGGERAYRLHRRGEEVEMPVRSSTVHELLVRRHEPPLLELELHVSSGTYVRSIADALGGHCRTLRRTAVGPFRVEDADGTTVLPPLAAVDFLPRRDLGEDEARLVRSGRPVGGVGDGPVALVCNGDLLAVAQPREGLLQPETVMSS
jgi:tRNA pseudouridine55 synthase